MRPYLALACAGLIAPTIGQAQPDLSGTVPVIDERFEAGLSRYDGSSGVWSTGGQTGRIMTNAAQAVFLDQGILPSVAETLLPDLHVISPEGLSLRTARLPEPVLDAVRDWMTATGQGKLAEQVRYGTARISTAQTWSQTYGYFEIEARVPRGKGRWPAFWLTFAGPGWPPEIDVMEAYGAGIDAVTPKDNTYNTAVYFDVLDAEGDATHSVELENLYVAEGEGRTPEVKKRGDREIYKFHRILNAANDLGADIYGELNTYAALWTPEVIIFYFGEPCDDLREVFRTPTPDDLHDSMYVIANDQFTARGGIWPARASELSQVLDPENGFVIRNITVRAFEPALTVDMAIGARPFDAEDSVILDTTGDDLIAPGEGFDIIRLAGGADAIRLSRGRDQKIIEGFGQDDILELEGYPFADAEDVLLRLTQVGPDTWLPSGADPYWPHTVVFRNTRATDFIASQFRPRWSVARDAWASDARRPNRPLKDSDGDGTLAADRSGGAWLNDSGNAVTMMGTEQPDRFLVSNQRSTIISVPDEGLDEVFTTVEFSLPTGIHRAVARGRSPILVGTPDEDRLETEAKGTLINGGDGDDLYVVHPKATETRIRVLSGDGNDRIRGLHPGDRVELPAEILTRRAEWQVENVAQGVLVRLSEDQSILFEGFGSVDTDSVFVDIP